MSRSDQKRFRTPSPLAGEGRGEGDRHLTHVAKRLRREMTDAELILWREVRARRFAGFKFKRQEPLGSYIVDFVCYEARLIVELDGGQHATQQEADAERTRWLESRGFRLVRFWNNDVLTNIAGVMQELEKELNTASPPLPGPLPPGEREMWKQQAMSRNHDQERFNTPIPSTAEGEDEEKIEKGKQ